MSCYIIIIILLEISPDLNSVRSAGWRELWFKRPKCKNLLEKLRFWLSCCPICQIFTIEILPVQFHAHYSHDFCIIYFYSPVEGIPSYVLKTPLAVSHFAPNLKDKCKAALVSTLWTHSPIAQRNHLQTYLNQETNFFCPQKDCKASILPSTSIYKYPSAM